MRTVSRIRAESRAARRRRRTDSCTPTTRLGERLLTPAGTSFYVRRAGGAYCTGARRNARADARKPGRMAGAAQASRVKNGEKPVLFLSACDERERVLPSGRRVRRPLQHRVGGGSEKLGAALR